MRAVVYPGYRVVPSLTEVAAPDCPADGVVLDVGATGVCRSDWHAWQGHDPVPLPHIPGHELAGTVAAAGPEVTRWRPGDRVTVPFVCGCGTCEYCRAGQAQVCPRQTQPGFTGPGSFAEQVAIPAADVNLVGLPGAVSFVTAACLGCRFATAFRALTGHGRVRAGDWLAVHGCGGAGLSAVLIGAALGARVIAVDVAQVALDQARELGAAEVIGAGPGGVADSAAAIQDLTGGRHVQVGLLLGPDAAALLPMDLVIARELEIYGSHGMAAADYPAMLALIADRTLRPERLVGQVIGLAGAGAALAALGQPPAVAGMTVIDLTR